MQGRLSTFQTNDPSLNGFIVGHLLDLRARESRAMIQNAYEHGCVDPTIAGDWYDIEDELS